MKKICFLVLVGLCLCLVATAQAEVQDLGEVCLTLMNTTGNTPGRIHLRILSYGTDTFLLNGKNEGNRYTVIPFNGTAVIVGNTVIMSLNGSSMEVGIFSGTYSISIDLLTLSGVFNSITNEQFKGTGPPDPIVVLSYGTVTLQACP